MDSQQRDPLIEGVIEAGRQVLAIYQRDFDIATKADDSPLTEADMAAHHALVALLGHHFPEVPVLSEEDAEVAFEQRRQWDRYFLIDPLDGTKEFINKNGEFTLNVALIAQGEPVFGIVHAPVLGVTWWGAQGIGAFRREEGGDISIKVRPLPAPDTAPWHVVASRRHGSDALEAFCARLPAHERVSMGSSIKLCLVAEGKADLYPRFAPTCEWDTAAAHAVVRAAGGEVMNIETRLPLRYNQKASLLNPWFMVHAGPSDRWVRALDDSEAS
ncbi:3'(2'),5'-bisphosphate nucleotidase CysQ [Larsenimonas rhizosphaerae]|uniref:3'(2'),5'-bisphosphate nucleotidase CysQ n=1 Tax=Larsenimonas rhizosphaerae TaxID=2944682 RepID=UPI0020338E83|nr:3'(2'),5'-bisphosphate nucleotidase CysQ [Larsenimonas rhizosphaerae]MCM2131864.1 3'(2'),5'-bisphosphate nucleotidase CysQ [Larsenimonas rhizosphaerae]